MFDIGHLSDGFEIDPWTLCDISARLSASHCVCVIHINEYRLKLASPTGAG
jgi:hypothetical protein